MEDEFLLDGASGNRIGLFRLALSGKSACLFIWWASGAGPRVRIQLSGQWFVSTWRNNCRGEIRLSSGSVAGADRTLLLTRRASQKGQNLVVSTRSTYANEPRYFYKPSYAWRRVNRLLLLAVHPQLSYWSWMMLSWAVIIFIFACVRIHAVAMIYQRLWSKQWGNVSVFHRCFQEYQLGISQFAWY